VLIGNILGEAIEKVLGGWRVWKVLCMERAQIVLVN
jgi:hypothetical protein